MDNQFSPTANVVSLPGASDRMEKFVKAVNHFDWIMFTAGWMTNPKMSRDAVLDMNRAETEVRLIDGFWPDRPPFVVTGQYEEPDPGAAY